MKERWAPIESLGIEVSSAGRARNAKSGHTYRTRQPDPYVRLVVHRKRKNQHKFMHRLVAEAFIGPPPTPKHVVNHRNGVKHDNRVENLEWVTAKGNAQHAAEAGLVAHGCRVGIAKLNTRKVRQIRRAYAKCGTTYRELGGRFGVNAVTVWHVVQRRTWQRVS